MLTDYIEPLYFFIALFVGLLIVYTTTPPPDVIVKYPTPDNVDRVVYQDDNDNCYQYDAQEVTCPTDRTILADFVPQHSEGKPKGLLDHFY